MMNLRICPALALVFSLVLVSSASAEPICSGGNYAADASVVPDPSIGTISVATQYAWDGGGRLAVVCDLLTEGSDFFATWSLFSGEVDRDYPGICVSLTSSGGTEWYSCQTPEAVTAAFAARSGTEQNVLRFETWNPAPPTLN